jgi:PAS domain S-box-containing protein
MVDRGVSVESDPPDTGGKEREHVQMMDRGFILLRFVLIIATSSLLVVEVGPSGFPLPLVGLMAAALLSNIALLALPGQRLRSPWVVTVAVLGDTAWITAALLVTGRFTADFFYLYFFVLFLAGVAENIRLIAVSVLVVCLAYVVLVARAYGPDQLLTSGALIRIPFLFTVAVFYGYLVDRLRGERHRVDKERAIIEKLERHQRVLAEANERLETEVIERRRVEQELRKFSRAVEQSSNLVIIIDGDDKIEFVNPLFEQITDLRPGSIMGRGVDVLTQAGAPDEAVAPLTAAVRNRSEWRGEIPLKQGEAGGVWLAFSTSPVRNADGLFTNTTVIATDISERVSAERQLTETNIELHRLSQVKSNFVSTVSHELKSPLTVIKNAVSLVDPEAGAETNQRFLQMIRRGADRLNYIISDLLDMSKVESGKLTIAAEPVDPTAFLSDVIEPFKSQAATAGLDLQLEGADGIPEVLADAKRVEQVITNLLSNAFKATPEGGRVVVSADCDGDRVKIRVRDTGIGLSDEDRRKVFDAFFQAGNALSDRPAGTGLGLTICRDLVRGHGSELLLESKLGAGTEFSFHLPVASERATEIIAFENQVRTKFRAHPYFSMLVIDMAQQGSPSGGYLSAREFETLHSVLRHHIPRALDIFCDQPRHDRVIVVLLSTPVDGGWVVKRRLASTLATNLFEVGGRGMASLRVLGPAAYPDDGEYGAGLIECAILRGETTEEEA